MIWQRTLPFVRGVRWTGASKIRFTARSRQWLTSLHFLECKEMLPQAQSCQAALRKWSLIGWLSIAVIVVVFLIWILR